jgi:membrane protein implicated in regulation of membrane protease activity
MSDPPHPKSDHAGLPLGGFLGAMSASFLPDRWSIWQVAAFIALEIAAAWAIYRWVARRRRRAHDRAGGD